MENAKRIEELARKIQQCLSEAGVKADVDLSAHEAVIHTKSDTEGQIFRVIAHITDREVTPADHGPVAHEIARARLTTAVIRPTLAVQTATSSAAESKYAASPSREQQRHSGTEGKKSD